MPAAKERPRRPCLRCGIKIEVNPRAVLPGVCRDCRASDPTWVDAVTRGVRCA